MEDQKSPPASAPDATRAPAPRPQTEAEVAAAKLAERKQREQENKRRSFPFMNHDAAPLLWRELPTRDLHSHVREHLLHANRPREEGDDEQPHPTVQEHLEIRGHFSKMPLLPSGNPVLDPITGAPVILHPWQRQALLARFHAEGIHHEARMSPEVFEAAFHEALHGRI